MLNSELNELNSEMSHITKLSNWVNLPPIYKKCNVLKICHIFLVNTNKISQDNKAIEKQ